MRNVIYIIEQPLSKWNYDRFGIKFWSERGWKLEVWDLTQLLNLDGWDAFIRSGASPFEFEGHYHIKSDLELEQRYLALKGGEYYVSAFGQDLCHLKIMMRLSQLGALRIWSNLGCIPSGSSKRGIPDFISRLMKLTRSTSYQLKSRILSRIYRTSFNKRYRPAIVVVSGRESIPSFMKIGNTRMVLAHNLDYDNYLRIRNNSNPAKSGHILFVEQNLCFHTDYELESTGAYVTPDRYFPQVRDSLLLISAALETNVLIAAHPRFNPKQVKNMFYGIPVEYGTTAELIRDSRVVVGHNSTAIQMAVLFQKPIVFITTDEIEATELASSIRAVASELGKTTINIDQDINAVEWRRELTVDLMKYKAYKEKYIKMDGSLEKPAWEIVIDHIEKNTSFAKQR